VGAGVNLGPVKIGTAIGGGVGLELTKGNLEQGRWELGVGIGGEKGAQVGLQWKKVF